MTFIAAYIAENGYSPSYKDMMLALGFRSKNGVHRLVHELLVQGKLRKHRGHSRNLEIGYPLPNELPTFAHATIQWAEKNGYRVEFKPI